MSMLQRGKDLARDVNAPTFIKPEVSNLDTSWNEAYSHTVEKLKKLKGIFLLFVYINYLI